MAKYRIVAAIEVSRQAWQSYVDGHEHGTVFHTPYMYDVFSSSAHHQAYAFFALDSNGEICAILTGFHQTVKPGLLSFLSKRSVMLQSPLYNNPEALVALLNHYRDYAPKNTIYTELRNHIVDQDYRDVCNQIGMRWESHYNIVKPLPGSVDLLRKDLSKKRRGGVNKALKENYSLEINNSEAAVNKFYHLLGIQYKQLRLPYPSLDFFHNCVSQDSQDNCYYFNLQDRGQIKISELAFIYKSTIHLLYIGISQEPEFLNKRPVDLFHYLVMQWCISNNIKFFDWMGAGKPGTDYGVRDFKLQYGGDLVDYGRFTIIHSPLKYNVARVGLNMVRKMGKIS